MAEAQYAQTHGVLLLERVVSAVGPIFTIAEAQAHAETLGIGAARVRWLLSRLAGARWIARLKQGVYAAQSPPLGAELHPFAIAAALAEPMAVSHWSALAHHGLTTQIRRWSRLSLRAAW